MEDKQTIAKVLSVITVVLFSLCVFLPVFTLFNYRIYMLFYLLFSICFLFQLFKSDNQKLTVICSCIMLVLAIVPVILGPFPSVAAASFLAAIISLVALFKAKIEKKSLVFFSLFLPCVVVIIKQGISISDYFNSHELAKSGIYDIPKHVADQMLISGFNEIGMLIILFGLALCCVALVLTHKSEKKLSEEWS